MSSRVWGALVLGLVLAALAPGIAQAKRPTDMVPDAGAHSARVSHAVRAHQANLPYGGGPVLHWNRTHVIFWQPAGSGLTFDPGYTALIETFLRGVAADSRDPSSVYGITGQYRDGKGPAADVSAYGGSVLATDPLPANGCAEPPATGPGWHYCLTDHQLQAEIEHVVRSDRLPTRTTDVYFLVTPDGLGNCSDSASTSCALGGNASGYCAYHSQTDDGLVLYAVIPFNAVPGHCQSDNPRPNNNTADPALSTISHEQSEMITDPSGNAWIDPQSGDEDGDLCLTSFGPNIGGSGAGAWNEQIGGGHYYLQEEWSNADSSCQPRAKPDSVSFLARTPTSLRSWYFFLAHAQSPHGRIVSYRWFFGDGRGASGVVASHSYRRSGRYRVVLRTTDSWGNWAFYTRMVLVRAR